MKKSDMQHPSVREVCKFLTDYSSELLGSGATCIRMDKNVKRIAAAYGMQVEMAVMPRHVHLTVCDSVSDEIITSIAPVKDVGANFTINTDLSRLSWKISDEKISFSEARKEFQTILRGTNQNPWLLLLLVAAANASFCRLFGGDAVAMGIVAVATMAGYRIKQIMQTHKVDLRIVFFVCAFVSSIIGATDILFAVGDTPSIALGTSVLYLVPGIPFLNSFSDMLYKHYLCAFSRFADALVLTCCLSAGLCLGMTLMDAGMF